MFLIYSVVGVGVFGYLVFDYYSYFLVFSFVRFVIMDKWKDIEFEKMKVGGNVKFREFLEF